MRGTSGARAWRVLLLVPYAGVLWAPFFNSLEPAWLGIPFFYWYQLAWIPLSAVLITVVYFKGGAKAAHGA